MCSEGPGPTILYSGSVETEQGFSHRLGGSRCFFDVGVNILTRRCQIEHDVQWRLVKKQTSHGAASSGGKMVRV